MSSSQSKYSEVLDRVGKYPKIGILDGYTEYIDNLKYEEKQTIEQALRIADRLERGDISEEMMKAGLGLKPDASRFVFKSMAAQLIKEEENSK